MCQKEKKKKKAESLCLSWLADCHFVLQVPVVCKEKHHKVILTFQIQMEILSYSKTLSVKGEKLSLEIAEVEYG